MFVGQLLLFTWAVFNAGKGYELVRKFGSHSILVLVWVLGIFAGTEYEHVGIICFWPMLLRE